MDKPTSLSFKIYQGSTFLEVFRWESRVKEYAPITNIVKSAPVSITSTAHGIPDGWRAKVTSVLGMEQINSTRKFYPITVVDSNTIEINDINSLDYDDYTSGGVLEYYVPKSLAGYTARMQIREKITDTDFIDELTTENGGITINDTNKSIAVTISATATADYDFRSAVYSLELIAPDSKVTQLVIGKIKLQKEVTR